MNLTHTPEDTPDVQILTFYIIAFTYYRLADIQTDKLRVVTSGHVTEMAFSICYS